MSFVAKTSFLKALSLLSLISILCFSMAHADEVVVLADDELPNESVTPILDSPYAVQEKVLKFTKRWQAQAGTGWLLDEPFYQNMFGDVRMLYNWSEGSGIGLRYMNFPKGVSTYGSQFSSLNFDYGHGPERGYGLVYENRFIYGKFSFSKANVLPITIQTSWELGMIQYGSKSLPYGGVGVGNSVFFNTKWGVSLTVKFLARQAFDSLSQSLRTRTTPLQDNDFTVKNSFSTGLDLGLIYLM
jgi:hypothetical protein